MKIIHETPVSKMYYNETNFYVLLILLEIIEAIILITDFVKR